MSGCPLFVSLTAAPPSQGARRRGSPSRQEATRVPARQSRTGLPCCPCDRRLALPESRAPECPRPRATYGRLPVTRIQALVSKACLSRFLMVRGGCCPTTPDCTSDATVPQGTCLGTCLGSAFPRPLFHSGFGGRSNTAGLSPAPPRRMSQQVARGIMEDECDGSSPITSHGLRIGPRRLRATTFRKPSVWPHGTIASLGAKRREFPATN